MTSFIDEYHILYEKSRIWEKNSWFGIPSWKLPMDMMVIQELIVRLNPDFIIETGTGHGGSAMFYASICELLGKGKVITIDIESTKKDGNEWGKFKWEDRIKFIDGGSINKFTIDKVKKIVDKSTNCMVILDSWHGMEHVYQEMEIYSKFVPIDGYMIIEDSHVAGNPVPWRWSDTGPMGAIDKWLTEEKDKWIIDWECEKHLLSFNPRGYLRRVK